jgi:hypothetical protein
MESYILLSGGEKLDIWKFFDKKFSFKPSVKPQDWPSITLNEQYLKIDIKNLWGETFDIVVWDDFELKAINAFSTISAINEYIYALDWNHDCYLVDPKNFSDFKNDLEAKYHGYISFIPDGDYYIFISKDMKNIWFGHPWEKTVTLIGTKLIDAFVTSGPLFLSASKLKK